MRNLTSIEQSINHYLNRSPKVKRVIKRAYQRTMVTVSHQKRSEGDIIRISPNDPPHEYFFGYYDKSPWDTTDRYMLCLRAKDTRKDVSPKEKADIILIDTEKEETDSNRIRKLADTHTWNVQQGCMLQWLGPDHSSRIIYNDLRDGKYASVILNIVTGEEKILPMPVYTVSADGKTALTLDFSRLYNLRPGYGYYNLPEKTAGIPLPEATAIWKMEIESGSVEPLLSYKDFASFQPRKEMQGENVIHKVNHLMLSPGGGRFMVLYRWFRGERKYTRLITCNTDGSEMYLLSDDDMVSHCCWKDEEHILAFENKKNTGPGYYLMQDMSKRYAQRCPSLCSDGHPSYSPDGKWIITDTYPDRTRISELRLLKGDDDTDTSVKVIARVFSPFQYDNDTRCDLHPRWNRAGSQICFDGVFEGHRGLYAARLKDRQKELTDKTNQALVSCVIPTYKRPELLPRAIQSALNQTYHNIEVLVVDDNENGSEDSRKTKEIIEGLHDNRIRYIKPEKHVNGAAARNSGVRAAKGEYIAFLDDDDEWHPEKTEKQITYLQNSGVGGVTCLAVFKKNGKIVQRTRPYNTDNLQFMVMVRKAAIYMPTFLCVREQLIDSGLFDESLSRHQDIQLFVNFLAKERIGLIPECLVDIHNDSEINRPNAEELIRIKKEFFQSIKGEFRKLNRCQRRRVLAAHHFEVIIAAAKTKRYDIALRHVAKVGLCPIAYFDVTTRAVKRIWGRI